MNGFDVALKSIAFCEKPSESEGDQAAANGDQRVQFSEESPDE